MAGPFANSFLLNKPSVNLFDVTSESDLTVFPQSDWLFFDTSAATSARARQSRHLLLGPRDYII